MAADDEGEANDSTKRPVVDVKEAESVKTNASTSTCTDIKSKGEQVGVAQ